MRNKKKRETRRENSISSIFSIEKTQQPREEEWGRGERSGKKRPKEERAGGMRKKFELQTLFLPFSMISKYSSLQQAADTLEAEEEKTNIFISRALHTSSAQPLLTPNSVSLD